MIPSASPAEPSSAAFESHDAACQTTLGPVGHHAPGGVKGEQLVIADAEETGLLGAHPLWIPGHIHLRDPAILFESVGAGVSDQAALQSGTIGHGFSWLAPLSGKGEGKATFWREDHITAGKVPHGSEKIAIGFHLNLVAQQLPCPMNVACVDAAWWLNRG